MTSDGEHHSFPLDESADLVSHHRDSTMYHSLLEKTFAQRFSATDSGWQIEHEVAVINLEETVCISDFAFRHADGRTALMEIVGYWRPEYLKKDHDAAPLESRRHGRCRVRQFESGRRRLRRCAGQCVLI